MGDIWGEYWKVIIAAVSAVVIFGGPKIVKMVKSVKLPNLKSNKNMGPEPYLVDQESIRHLRQRAQEYDDKDLLEDIKAIHAKFYDIHCGDYSKSANISTE